ncbi:uncharacterized protein [Porites lutea]|uniref:uncharacterized protein n=1 Tax=Porites lutea TaxID=51062 RepID=UPI003CC55819
MENRSVMKSLYQFVNTVEEMEKAVLVPQSLQDMSLSSSNGVVLENSLFESFTVLRNIKNIVLTGHALDDENGNTPHTPFSDELLALTETLQKLTGLANNLTAEYKEKFNLLF